MDQKRAFSAHELDCNETSRLHADDAAMNHGLSDPPNRLNGRSIDRSTDFTRLISFSDRSGMVQDHHLQTCRACRKKPTKIGPICPRIGQLCTTLQIKLQSMIQNVLLS